MNLPAPKPTTPNPSLSAQLQQIGLRALPGQLDDFLAHAAKARWSPHQILEQLAQAEITERARRSLEQRLRLSGIKKFKPMADFEWAWPSKIERDVIERALTLDFIPEARNLVLVGRNGLGKTMIAQNICHAAVLAGYSVLFRSAPALLDELQRQGPEGRRSKLRSYANAGLVCVDEVGYLSFDDKAADLLYEVINRRYERKSVILTTTNPSRTGTRCSRMRPALSPCWTASCITPTSQSLRAKAIGFAKASRKPPRAGKRNDAHRGPSLRCRGPESLRRSAGYARASRCPRSMAGDQALRTTGPSSAC
jgi:DNA replication protein DnaC